jgi:hypothetical protein
MKRFFAFAFILALVSIPAFAASKSATVRFTSDVTVGSSKLPAGEYKLTYDGTAPNVQVTLVEKGGSHPKTATVPAKLTEQKHEHISLTTTSANGGDLLQNVQLKDVTLEFTTAPVSGQ